LVRFELENVLLMRALKFVQKTQAFRWRHKLQTRGRFLWVVSTQHPHSFHHRMLKPANTHEVADCGFGVTDGVSYFSLLLASSIVYCEYHRFVFTRY